MNNLKKYLSLKAAGQLYGYTRDHLGLMIRLKKLNGIKLGSYYVTTSEWMNEYIKKFANPKHPILKNKLSNKFLSEAFQNNLQKKSPNNLLDSTGDNHYSILPIRKMKSIEKDEILRRTEKI